MSEFKLQQRQLDLVALVSVAKFILASGSSRGGKTFAFLAMLVMRALMFPGSNHLVVRHTGNSITSTVWKTALEVLNAIAPGYRDEIETNGTNRFITLHNGSTIWFMGAQNEEAVAKIMGAQFATILINEIVDIDFETYQDIVSRLNAVDENEHGELISLKLFADCNPKTFAHWVYQQWYEKRVPGTYRDLEDSDEFAFIEFDKTANEHVDPSYYKSMRNWSAEKQARFLDGQWRAESGDALFPLSDLDNNRQVRPDQSEFEQTVVAVDPAMTSGPNSDETGVFVVGAVGEENDAHYYPIEDLSGRYHPVDWATIAIKAYWAYGAKAIVVEVNQGGDQNVHIIKAIDPRVNVVTVRAGAGQGKNERAKPIATLMRSGRIHHPFTDEFKELEQQMLAMTGDYDRKRGKSPDRLDAYVYGIGELLTGDGPVKPLVVSKIANYFR